MRLNILVTGASGFIGKSLMQTPAKGLHLTGVYRRLHQTDPADSCICDLSESFEPDQDFDTIVHLAAGIPLVGDRESALSAAAVNRKIDDNVINYCRSHAGTRLIFFSSSSVYNRTSGPWTEDLDVLPDNEYSCEKLTTEKRIQRELDCFDIVRLNAPYGPGQTHRTVVTRFINQAIQNETLQLFGDGLRKQAFTYIDDIVRFVHCLLDTQPTNSVMNVAGSELVTMSELAQAVLLAIPKSSSTIKTCYDIEDPFADIVPVIDCCRATALTGWRSATSLADGIKCMAVECAAEITTEHTQSLEGEAT